ncbi:unnamed protein product, partial [Amoebophrya sp. A25]
ANITSEGLPSGVNLHSSWGTSGSSLAAGAVVKAAPELLQLAWPAILQLCCTQSLPVKTVGTYLNAFLDYETRLATHKTDLAESRMFYDEYVEDYAGKQERHFKRAKEEAKEDLLLDPELLSTQEAMQHMVRVRLFSSEESAIG